MHTVLPFVVINHKISSQSFHMFKDIKKKIRHDYLISPKLPHDSAVTVSKKEH